jgi:hypothetical protein
VPPPVLVLCEKQPTGCLLADHFNSKRMPAWCEHAHSSRTHLETNSNIIINGIASTEGPAFLTQTPVIGT